MRRLISTPSPAMGVSLVALFIALGGTATAATIAVNSVGTSQLKKNAVTAAKIKNFQVTGLKLAPKSVSSAKVVDGTILSADLAKNAVNSDKVADGAIGTADLAANAVTSAKVADGTLAAADLAANSVTTPAVSDSAITSAKVADGTIVLADLAANSVDASKVVDGSLTTADVAPNTFLQKAAVSTHSVTPAVQLTATTGAKQSFTASCPAGKVAVGGGGRSDDLNSELAFITSSRPTLSTTAPPNEPPAEGQAADGWRITVVNQGNNAGLFPTVWVMCAG